MTKISRIMDNRNKDSNPFADYVWMGDMDSFDREIEAQIEEEFEEEEFIKSCIEQLLEEEEERETVFFQKPNEFDTSNVPNGHHIPEQPNTNMYPPMNEFGPNCNVDIIQNMTDNMYISHQRQLDELPAAPHQHYPNGDIPFPPQQPYQNGDMPLNLPFHYWLQCNGNGTVGNTEPISYPGPTELQSTLNPLASPFVMNPNAKVFVPQSSNNGEIHKKTST